MAAIRDLLDAGSGSLGGARPKASVADGDRLLLVKFPHRNDDWDIMAWEKTALDLADAAGLPTPPHRLAKVGRRNVLVLDRFDRDGERRIPYVSAMTLIAGRDGDSHDYTDIAEYLPEYGSNVVSDMTGLFRRAAFGVAIHNTDDHMRNHGFLFHGAGWQLAPVFDVNPNPDLGAARQTRIGFADRVGSEIDGLDILAGECRLDSRAAAAIIDEVRAAVSGWRDVATSNGISDQQQSLFADMFEYQQAVLAASAKPKLSMSASRAQRRAKTSPRSNRGSFGSPG